MRRNDQPSRPNAMTCSRFSLLKTWLMTTEANFPLQQLCLKPSLYGRFSPDHLWPVLRDHRGGRLARLIALQHVRVPYERDFLDRQNKENLESYLEDMDLAAARVGRPVSAIDVYVS